LPTGRASTLLSKVAENRRLWVAPGAIVFSGCSENSVLLFASSNWSAPDALFSVNVALFSELALGSMCAVVAASPLYDPSNARLRM